MMNGPALDRVKISFADTIDRERYPFCIPIIKNLQDIHFPASVTFFVGENGIGKSTILEAIAYKAGFGPEGGSKNIRFTTAGEEVTYLDQLGGNAYGSYGGKSLHEQSHGESFLSFFKHRLRGGGFFIFDEPEAALSPQRQLSLLRIMHDLCARTGSQFIIVTHSPILLAYPGATIYTCDGDALSPIAYEDTDHYQVTKKFLENPQRYLHYLFAEGERT